MMQQLIYFDTDAFRHFAGAYQKRMLPPDLRHNIVLSPITMLEVFTHLAERCGESIYKQIQGLPNWLNQKDVHLLPWPDEYISLRLFDKLPEDDLFTCAVQEIVQTCLNGLLADVLEDVGELRECTVCIKRKYATAFQALVEIHRNEQRDMGELSEGWLKYRGKQYTDGDRARILEALSAFHEFDLEKVRLAVSSKNFDYDSQKHQNDALDCLQVAYLCDPTLNLVTCNKGYLLKIRKSPQRNRIHQASWEILSDSDKAETLLRQIIG